MPKRHTASSKILTNLATGVRIVHALKTLPGLGLGGLDEIDQSDGIQYALAMCHVSTINHLVATIVNSKERMPVIALEVTAPGRTQKCLDFFLEIPFLGLCNYCHTSRLPATTS